MVSGLSRRDARVDDENGAQLECVFLAAAPGDAGSAAGRGVAIERLGQRQRHIYRVRRRLVHDLHFGTDDAGLVAHSDAASVEADADAEPVGVNDGYFKSRTAASVFTVAQRQRARHLLLKHV